MKFRRLIITGLTAVGALFILTGQEAFAAESATPSDASYINDISDEETVTHDIVEGVDDSSHDSIVKDDICQGYGFEQIDESSFSTDYSFDIKTEGDIEADSFKSTSGVTVMNGVDYSAVYDYYYYVKRYPDIKAAYGDDQTKALNHFLKFGMSERRVAKENFDVTSYIKAYPDLRAVYRNDMSRYYEHYMKFGSREGRVSTGVTVMEDIVTSYDGFDYKDVYNFYFYMDYQKDLKKALGDLNDYGALEHFVKYGMREKRVASDEFHLLSYSNAHRDLREVYANNWPMYYIHYIKFGKAEKRVTSGVPYIKDPVTVKDGVDYSKVYDYMYYVKNNADLNTLLEGNDITALDHFVNQGMKRWRRGNASFDVISYGNAYRDLRDAFGGNYPKYYLHYIKFGYREGRVTQGVTRIVNPNYMYEGKDFSKVLDMVYYLENNKDVRDTYGGIDEKGIIGHFAKIGAYQGRLGKPEQASYNGVQNSGFRWPAPVSSNITSYFGERVSPGGIGSTNHKGIDIGSTRKNGKHVEINGTYAVASLPGTVYYVGYDEARGNYVLINHGEGLVTIYQHFSRNILSVGDKVGKGDPVGIIGSTGHSTGPHLHFEVVVNGTPRNPLNYVSP